MICNLLALLLLLSGTLVLMGQENPRIPDPDGLAIPAGGRLEWPVLSTESSCKCYAEFTGMSVRLSPEARGVKFSLLVSGPLTNRDAARFIENQLLLEGFVFQETGPGELKLVMGAGAWKMPAADAKRPEFPRSPDPDALAVPEGQFFEHSQCDVTTCALLYHTLTGKRILLPANLSRLEVSIRVPGPLTNGEAAALVEKALLAKGVFLKEFAPSELAMIAVNPSVVEQLRKIPGPPAPRRVRRVPSPQRRMPPLKNK